MLLVADLGPLHAQLPLYNAQTVLEIIRASGRSRVIHAGLTAQAWASGAWRDLEHPVLFALDDDRVPLTAIAPDWTWAVTEQAQMLEFLNQYPKGRARVQEAGRAEAELRQVLAQPLDAPSVHSALMLEAVKAYHTKIAELLEEGPGTAHRAKRLEAIKRELELLEPRDAVVIVPLDDLPELLELPSATLPDLAQFQPGEPSRFRSVIDRAYRLEDADDLDALVHMLLDLDGPPDSSLGRMALEARFAASGLYLAVGDLESARDLLEAVAQGHFERPAYLPGFVLTRLGQVRDLMGERDHAKRAYTAALGLRWLPSEARTVALSGLELPYSMV